MTETVRMRILYVALKYDYGKLEQGYSFEHHNFYHSLLHMGHDILYFDFMTLMQEHGRESMNRRLLEVAKEERPDLLFAILFREELDKAILREISGATDTLTLNWFCDDHWRFDTFSRDWAPCFNWVVTTAKSALPKYESLGYRNVIKSQWACNHFLYRGCDRSLQYPVSFVGRAHGNRPEIIAAIRDGGVDMHVWGTGWASGRLSQAEMIEVFSRSRINLNLSNASTPTSPGNAPGRRAVRGWLSRTLNSLPFGLQIKTRGRQWLASLSDQQSAPKRSDQSTASGRLYPEQIKARNFEIPGCGGFLLTGLAEDLECYYEVNKEIACFHSVEELVDKAQYYLRNEDERAAIANAGRQRTLREHTYVHRFNEVFQHVGLPSLPLSAILEGKVNPGRVQEVC